MPRQDMPTLAESIKILEDSAAVAEAAAVWIAAQARAAVAERGIFTLAVSGGSTPWAMLRSLASQDVPWSGVHVFQVDERAAPPGDADRNLTHLRESLLAYAPLPEARVHPMPVEMEDLEAAAQLYTHTLSHFAGSPPILDVVHLGLGADGHTASLVPDDPVLGVGDQDVAVTNEYKGRKRLTLTYPILDRARHILWLVTGDSKIQMLERLLRADPSIPAGRVPLERAVVLADRAASGT